MTSRDFVFWLQGFFEITEPKEINEKQTEMIKNHLNLVFYHEVDNISKQKEELNDGISIQNDTEELKESYDYLNKTDEFFADDNNGILRC